MEDKRYPIYRVAAKWSQKIIKGEWTGHWISGLPEGRMWSSTGFSIMFKEEKTEEELQKYLDDWWDGYLKNKESIVEPNDIEITIKLTEYETWCLSWFEHWTFDIGQTDEQALESFEKFVTRKEIINEEHERKTGDYLSPPYCLMGAEDRYRWRGANENGEFSSDASAPCRCKFCKEKSILSIAH